MRTSSQGQMRALERPRARVTEVCVKESRVEWWKLLSPKILNLGPGWQGGNSAGGRGQFGGDRILSQGALLSP